MPDGFDLKLNPVALVADHVIVAGLLNTRPVEPGGLVTAEGCVAGPIQRMSKDTVAPADRAAAGPAPVEPADEP